MTRKTPIEHEVGSHIRNGKRIEKYTRGEGSAPRPNPVMRNSSRVGSVYNVVFSFSDGSTESYNHSGTATGALKSALGSIQRPMVPIRATLTMLGG